MPPPLPRSRIGSSPLRALEAKVGLTGRGTKDAGAGPGRALEGTSKKCKDGSTIVVQNLTGRLELRLHFIIQRRERRPLGTTAP